MAIVSSYSDSCGNAYFTKFLIESIAKKGIDVVCEEVDLKLTQSIYGKVRKIADKHIIEIARKLREYDFVNIQLEAGLYGTIPSDIIRRIKILVNSNPNLSVTLHSPRLIADASAQREALKLFFQGKIKNALGFYLFYKQKNVHIDINQKIIKMLCERKVKLIVHTLRAKEQINHIFDYKNVVVHPLQLVSDNFLYSSADLDYIKKINNLSPTDVVIGIFGFVNEYKGHTLAIQALKLLPSNYKLMIFGRQHPQTLVPDQLCHPYLSQLQSLIDKEKLRDRVFFMGEYDTPRFLNFAASVDVCWLPYVENGQDGSGIASICLSVGKRVLCSSSFAFDELFRLVNFPNVCRFDIGNSIELAQKTKKMLSENYALDKRSQSVFTPDTQASAYIEGFD